MMLVMIPGVHRMSPTRVHSVCPVCPGHPDRVPHALQAGRTVQPGSAVQPRRDSGTSHPRPQRDAATAVALQSAHMSWTRGLMTHDAVTGAAVSDVTAVRHKAGVSSVAATVAAVAATPSEAATAVTASPEMPAPEVATGVPAATVGAASATAVHASAASGAAAGGDGGDRQGCGGKTGDAETSSERDEASTHGSVSRRDRATRINGPLS